METPEEIAARIAYHEIIYTQSSALTPLVVDTGTLAAVIATALRAYGAERAAAERDQIAAAWERWHGFDKYGVAAAIRAGVAN